jgi:hypothetical protein
MVRFVVLALAFVIASPAWCRPPPGSEPDPAVKAWFESLHRDSDNFPCCSAADCRRVDEYKIENNSYIVKAKREDFVMDATDAKYWDQRWNGRPLAWMMIPRGDITIRTDNPTGSAILCYSAVADRIFRFIPWDYKY